MKSICALFLLVICGTARGEIYKHIDPTTGEAQYTNRPKTGAVRMNTDDTIRDLNARVQSPQHAKPSTQRSISQSDSGSPYVQIAELAGATYSVNARALSGYGPSLGAWVMANWTATQYLRKPPPSAQTNGQFGFSDNEAAMRSAIARLKGVPENGAAEYRSTLTLYTFNCNGRTVYTQDVIFYAETSAQGEVVTRTRGGNGIENAVPGTLLETLLEKSCIVARQRGVVMF